jgi:NAD(P)-dependent dehydrogenase (short-subunit alcohol dehydrogenase family)
MERPVCLITGATDGVGKFTALELAQRGFTVVFAARDQAKAEPTSQRWWRRTYVGSRENFLSLRRFSNSFASVDSANFSQRS